MLSLTYGDKVFSLDRAIQITGIMEGYDLGIAKWIERDICDWEVRTDTALAFPCLLTQIFLDEKVIEIPGVYEFIKPLSNTNLDPIQDVASPISKPVKLGATLFREKFWAIGHRINTPGLTNIFETLDETSQSKPLDVDEAGTTQKLTPPPTARHSFLGQTYITTETWT